MKPTRRIRTVSLLVPCLTAFIASACVMAVEVLAGRIVARHLGSSLYTWTSVIGVVLGGLAAGNYVGGRLADRYRTAPTLAVLFILASAFSLLIPVANKLSGEWTALWLLTWPARIALHVALTFALPAAVLGAIGPVVAKMALDRGRSLGRTVGDVYAWGALGSILGTFATGFYLSAVLRIQTNIYIIAAVLALLGILFAVRHWLGYAWAALLALLAAGSFGPAGAPRAWAAACGLREVDPPNLLFDQESAYGRVRVLPDERDPATRVLLLDRLAHSFYNPERPDDLIYGYQRIYSAVTDHVLGPRESFDALVLGGGGLTHPRHLLHRRPAGRLQVVEIDPVVTQAAIAAFGFTPDPRVEIFHLDARQHLAGLARARDVPSRARRFDLVFLDAVTDYAVPSHLATVEFYRMVRSVLAPEGVFLVNLIDILDVGEFTAATVHTLRQVFSEVDVFFADETDADAPFDPAERTTFILVAADRDLALERMGGTPELDAAAARRLDPAHVDALLAARRPGVLTDDHAPVEHLMTEVVRRSGRFDAADRLYARAKRRAASGDAARAETDFRQALELNPRLFLAHIDLGVLLAQTGRADEAIAQFQRAAELRPRSTAPLLNLGTARYLRGEYAAAEADFRRVLDLRRDHIEARFSLAKTLGRQGRLAEALEAFKEVARLKPDYPRVRQHIDEVTAAMSANPPPASAPGA